MVIIAASRFFFLCWRYRIPFFYFFGVNALHICYGSIFTTNEMVMPHFALIIMICIMYAYGFGEMLLNTKLGKKLIWHYEKGYQLQNPRHGSKGDCRRLLWSRQTAEERRENNGLRHKWRGLGNAMRTAAISDESFDEHRRSKRQATSQRCNLEQDGCQRRHSQRRVQETRTYKVLEEMGCSALSSE